MWNFMPDVVLATTAVKQSSNRTSLILPLVDTAGLMEQDAQGQQEGEVTTTNPDSPESVQERHTRNMQYGTLISCIDFGDQLGAFVLGAMVATLNVTRENDWDHLGELIGYCALLGASSAVFILILR